MPRRSGESRQDIAAVAGRGTFVKWKIRNGKWVNMCHEVGKALVTVLRLRGCEAMDEAGWAPVWAILRTHKMRHFVGRDVEEDQVPHLVAMENDPKVRFLERVRDGVYELKAAQGHSLAHLDYDEVLRKVTPESAGWVSTAWHGTTGTRWPSIVLEGLYAGQMAREGVTRTTRQHVHMVAQIVGREEQAGVRGGSTVAIGIDVAALHEAGATSMPQRRVCC
jgi:RNA:NAD 2'-phosphotransferase (TPT1/KptA family)